MLKFSVYILNVRMTKAWEYLENPDMKIQDIALKTGYFTTQSFATAFKMHHGVTPSEYRNKIKIQEKDDEE